MVEIISLDPHFFKGTKPRGKIQDKLPSGQRRVPPQELGNMATTIQGYFRYGGKEWIHTVNAINREGGEAESVWLDTEEEVDATSISARFRRIGRLIVRIPGAFESLLLLLMDGPQVAEDLARDVGRRGESLELFTELSRSDLIFVRDEIVALTAAGQYIAQVLDEK